MPKLITEFLGTFFLVLVILLSVAASTAGANFAPIAIGLILMAMVYMGGHISGAHYNPAVTLAIIVRGRMKIGDALGYWAVQLVGAFAAAAIAAHLIGKANFPAPAKAADAVTYLWAHAAIVEVLFTFALALVVLNVATARATTGNSYYGAAIGLTVCAAAYAGGPISGGAFNPAVGAGPALFAAIRGDGSERSAALSVIPLYLLAPLAGGALAGFVFRVQNPGD